MSELPMNDRETEPLIDKASPDFKTCSVILTWRNGAKSRADFSHMVGEGIFKSFSDPKFFNHVELTHDGRALTWPKGIDFDSLLLWYTANPQTVPLGLKHHLPSKSPFAPKSVMIAPNVGG
ncbi:DUF2442 domain-containing protein [Bradyrhizobium diazoefficiens]|uniref:DUF2442 domain-containing protein n=1 Tax=Bradyrhizobium diazoefficiens TaxID=1355477 RepID=UPI00190B2526|nr:DUF2442 domain-containing protein [Bradyrhizobium diazoefficiens]MBK3665090.1 DUF2442 domain-containing protein [Bradyrhizobium diazoefficiens]